LLVEDSANPDATPFVVAADGKVAIGSTTTTENLNLVADGRNIFLLSRASTDVNPSVVSFRKARGTNTAPTIVASNDGFGDVQWSGYDGSTYIQSASIFAAVDGTPGTGDMPGRLVFSTTADGASSPTERMRIANNGSVFFGGNPANTNINLNVGKAITGGSNGFGVVSNGQIQTDVTGIAQCFSAGGGQIVGATTSQLRYYGTIQNTISGTVSNQFGFYADASLIGATANYGFYSNIGLGTSRTITFVERTTNVVTITTSVAHGYTAGQSVRVAAVTNTGVNGTFVIASVPTTTTLTYAQTGADIVVSSDTGTTLVVNRFNFYANGTAPNYFAGAVGIGTASPSATNLEAVSTSAAIVARGSATTSTAVIGVVAHDYYSVPSFKGTYLQQNSSATTGTTLGFANANLGFLAFQNIGAQALIYANGASAIVFGTTSIDRGRVSAAGVWSFGAAAGAESLRVTPVTSAVNYFNMQGSITGNTPALSVQGSDANIQFGVSSKGTSALNFFTNNFGQQQFGIVHTASAVNYLQATGGIATTGFPILSAVGTDTNIDLAINPKGTGNVRFGTLTANADAPITGYITIKDSAGTVRKLAVIA
jgi:hypothetical protein